MKSLIIGAGQVGSALYKILIKKMNVFIRDTEDIDIKSVDVLHICFPYSDEFAKNVREYAEKYNPKLIFIHSSVPIGTTKETQDLVYQAVIYMPVRGRHPKLEHEIKSFTSFISSYKRHKISVAKSYLRDCGFSLEIVDTPEELEFFKVMSNVHMGLEIAWRQELQRIMDSKGINSGNYEKWEKTYQKGCLFNNDTNLLRPIMNPDPIGGHCILSCLEIAKKYSRSKLFDFIEYSNNRAKESKLENVA